jgi:hypothetical protein
MSYEPAQVLVVKAVARRLELSVRGTRGLFEDRADLCRIVGFTFGALPCVDWFWRACADQTLSAKNN